MVADRAARCEKNRPVVRQVAGELIQMNGDDSSPGWLRSARGEGHAWAFRAVSVEWRAGLLLVHRSGGRVVLPASYLLETLRTHRLLVSEALRQADALAATAATAKQLAAVL